MINLNKTNNANIRGKNLITNGEVECPERPGEYLHIGALHRIKTPAGQTLHLYCTCVCPEEGVAVFADSKTSTRGIILHQEEWWFRVLDLRRD